MDSKPNLPVAKRPGIFKRLFAYEMSTTDARSEEYYGPRKRALLGNLHGTVLEIGPGTGPNLPYYAKDVTWIGIEPNPAMFPYLQKEAARLGLKVDLRDGQAEHLNAADNSVDAVVSTLVMCSVRDQAQVLKEVLRVLKPGGRFVFIEHVAAPAHTGRRRWQRIIRPAWQTFADGCQPDRETWRNIERAGFSSVQLEHFHIPVPVIGPHIAGVAIK